MLYTVLKIKIRGIIFDLTFSCPNSLEKSINEKPILQKPKNHVLPLKLKVKVTILYTFKSISSRGMLIGKNFPPNAKTKNVLDKKPIFSGKTLI